MDRDAFNCLYRSAGQVLSSMAAMEVRPATKGEPFRMKADVLDARIVYQGEHAGMIGLVLERDLAKRIASRMLGLQCENDILDDMIMDTARELINVICGHYLVMMFGDKPVLNISAPLIAPVNGNVCRRLLLDHEAGPFRVDEFAVLGMVKPMGRE